MLTVMRRLWNMLRRHAGAARSRRSQVLTARLFDSLPANLRRDIGWPYGNAGRLSVDEVADDEWKMPTADRPIAETARTLRGRRIRGGRAVSVPVSHGRVQGPLSTVRKPPVSS